MKPFFRLFRTHGPLMLCIVLASGCAMPLRRGAHAPPPPPEGGVIALSPHMPTTPIINTKTRGEEVEAQALGPPQAKTASSTLLSPVSATNFSVSAWFKCNSYPSDDQELAGVVAKYQSGSSANSEWMIGIKSDGKVTSRSTGGGSPSELTTSQAIVTGVWHHVAGTWAANGSAKLYFDGALASSGSLAVPVLGSAALTIGDLHPGDGTFAINGDLDEVRVWHKDLSLAEVVALHAATPDADGDGIIDGDDADDNNDGLPDDWVQANLNDPGSATPAGNPDGDDMTNIEEYIAGTDPETEDYFVANIGTELSPTSNRTVFVECEGALAGREYRLYYTDNLFYGNMLAKTLDPNIWLEVASVTNNSNGTLKLDVADSTFMTNGFFRIDVRLSD